MTYEMNYDITIGDYRLNALNEVKIKRSIDALSDTAVITLPARLHHRTLKLEGRIKVSNPVKIRLGYSNDLRTEFDGYVDKIGTDEGNLTIECLDALWPFKKTSLSDKVFKDVTVKALLGEVIQACDKEMKLECDYDTKYDKFTFYNASGYDVLKKVQDDFKANVYVADGVLHVHPPYAQVASDEEVRFDFSRNIESANLKYRKAQDEKVQVELTYKDKNGKEQKVKFGTEGGTKKSFKSPTSDTKEIDRLGKQIIGMYSYDGYEGSFTGWLIPYVAPTAKVRLHDVEYPEKDGTYYVTGTEVEFSSSGGKRTVSLGRRLT